MENPTKLKTALSEEGLVLFNESLNAIAFDRGAAGILSYSHPTTAPAELTRRVPKEIWDLVGREKACVRPGVPTLVQAGDSEYLCRAYLVKPPSGSPANTIVAVHLKKIWSANDAVREIAAKFLLTDREREVLSGISKGLTSTEIGRFLKVSPNTVRSFIQLITTKIGVAKRSELVAVIFKTAQAENHEQIS